MSLDQRARRAADQLREQVASDLPAARMLGSLRRTRVRRRRTMLSTVAALVVGVALVTTTVPHHASGTPVRPGPSTPTGVVTPQPRANGALFGYGAERLLHPPGLRVPPLSIGSTPTWAPDGSRVAVLAGGILVTDVHTGGTRLLRCHLCTEISWSPDGRTIAAATTGSDGRPLLLVDVRTAQIRSVPLPGLDQVRTLTWAPDSQHLAFLAFRPLAAQGAWTVGVDGSPPHRFVSHSTGSLRANHSGPVILSAAWAPTRQSIALLYATFDPARETYLLDVWTTDPDGTGLVHLVRNGTCACAGWAPELVWSPDGRTLLLSSLVRRPPTVVADGDGTAVQVRFAARASGPLTWQPLPR